MPLSIFGLKKNFAKQKKIFEAVRGLTFEVKDGQCFGLLGPNGAGKSTAINCITGFYPPTDGSVLVNGLNVFTQSKKAKALLGVCSQEDTLDSDFTVLDQMIQYATFFQVPTAEAKIRAHELLDKFNLTEKKHDMIETLSGGMRRRLQVARALISKPKVLILDEPTTGLDPEARRILWDVILDYRSKGGAILLSTHYMDEAERLCDHVGLIDNGLITDIGSPRDLIRKTMGEEWVEEEVRPGVYWKRPANLEDVFLKITGSKLGLGENRV